MLVQSGSVVPHTFFSEVLDRDYEYRAYFPPGYAPERTYPVLYLLHGRGDSMFAWDNLLDALNELIDGGSVPPLIAVMPDMPSSERAGYFVDSLSRNHRYSGELVETAFFKDLLPHIDHTLPVATERIGRIIAGYSMGGYGSVRYALAYPDIFSAAIVLSPAVYTPLPPQDSSARKFGAFGREDLLFDAERYRELTYPHLLETYSGGRNPLRFFIAVGDDEWKHPRAEEMMHDLDMEAHLIYTRLSRVNGVKAELRVYNGGHDWDVWTRGLAEGLSYLADHLRIGGCQRPENEVTIETVLP